MASTEVATLTTEQLRTSRHRVEQWLHREMYLGLQIVRGRPVGRYMRRLAGWDRLPADSFREIVERRLTDMLRCARSEVPLYATGPWASIGPKNAGELDRWPVLERAALIEQRALLLRRKGRRRLVARRSSASTGTPVEVFWNRDGLAESWAAEYQPMQWHGLSVGARTLRIWGSARPLESWVLNRRFVPAHELTPSRLDRALDYLERRQPQLVWGTPSAVSQFASHVGRRRRRSMPLVTAPLSKARTFLFAQLDRLRWRIQVEGPAAEDAPGLQRQVSGLLREVFGAGCIVDVEVVAKIAREPSGKYRYYRTASGGPGAAVLEEAARVS